MMIYYHIMQRFSFFIFSLVAQVTYWTTMLSAFDFNIPECFCWSDGGDPFTNKFEEKLSVVSLVPPTPSIRLMSIPREEKAFCKGAADLRYPTPANVQFLDHPLEDLLARANANVQICIEIGSDSSLVLLKTKSQELSSSDSALIRSYFQKNWPLHQLLNAGTMRPGERYHLRIEVLFTPNTPVLPL